jgi:hypothetical protein
VLSSHGILERSQARTLLETSALAYLFGTNVGYIRLLYRQCERLQLCHELQGSLYFGRAIQLYLPGTDTVLHGSSLLGNAFT